MAISSSDGSLASARAQAKQTLAYVEDLESRLAAAERQRDAANERLAGVVAYASNQLCNCGMLGPGVKCKRCQALSAAGAEVVKGWMDRPMFYRGEFGVKASNFESRSDLSACYIVTLKETKP